MKKLEDNSEYKKIIRRLKKIDNQIRELKQNELFLLYGIEKLFNEHQKENNEDGRRV